MRVFDNASNFFYTYSIKKKGGVVVDPELKVAEDILRKIFNANAENEKNKKKIGYFATEYLAGLDGENDYILVNNTLGGYAIFERDVCYYCKLSRG